MAVSKDVKPSDDKPTALDKLKNAVRPGPDGPSEGDKVTVILDGLGTPAPGVIQRLGDDDTVHVTVDPDAPERRNVTARYAESQEKAEGAERPVAFPAPVPDEERR